MATSLRRLEFKQRYPAIRQGLFIVPSEKRLPKGQEDIIIGRLLSKALSEMPEEDHREGQEQGEDCGEMR